MIEDVIINQDLNLKGTGTALSLSNAIPAIANRVFLTYAEMVSFISTSGSTCIPGIVLSVINDKIYTVKTAFKVGRTNYAVGTIIDRKKYDGLGDNQVNIEVTDGNGNGFYTVKKSQTINGEVEFSKLAEEGSAPAGGGIYWEELE